MNWQDRLLNVIPGGAHTYSRGSDQFPYNAPQILKRGKAALIMDESVYIPDALNREEFKIL